MSAEPGADTDGAGKKAPKRFKTGYIMFSKSRYKTIRQELDGLGVRKKTSDITKMIAAEWRGMNASEKQPWQAQSNQDRVRYEDEKALYMSNKKGKTSGYRGKRILKDESAPKRPASAYFLFANARRAATKKEHPDATNAELSKLLSNKWKSAGAEERSQYEGQATRSQAQYKIALAAWKKTKNLETKAKRRKLQKGMENSEKMARRSVGVEGSGTTNVANGDGVAAAVKKGSASRPLSPTTRVGQRPVGTMNSSVLMTTSLPQAEKDEAQPFSSSPRLLVGNNNASHATRAEGNQHVANTDTVLCALDSSMTTQGNNSSPPAQITSSRMVHAREVTAWTGDPQGSIGDPNLGNRALSEARPERRALLPSIFSLPPLPGHRLQLGAGMATLAAAGPLGVGSASTATGGLLDMAELQQRRRSLLGLEGVAGQGPTISDLSHLTASSQVQHMPQRQVLGVERPLELMERTNVFPSRSPAVLPLLDGVLTRDILFNRAQNTAAASSSVAAASSLPAGIPSTNDDLSSLISQAEWTPQDTAGGQTTLSFTSPFLGSVLSQQGQSNHQLLSLRAALVREQNAILTQQLLLDLQRSNATRNPRDSSFPHASI